VVVSMSYAAAPSVGGGPSNDGTLKLPFNVGAWYQAPFATDGHVSCKSEHGRCQAGAYHFPEAIPHPAV